MKDIEIDRTSVMKKKKIPRSSISNINFTFQQDANAYAI